MTKQTDCTTSTIPSSTDHFGRSVTITGPVVYTPPRVTDTRKQAYTKFLRDQCFYAGYECGYVGLPRKLKKRWNLWARRYCYYNKGRGVTRFDPFLLSYPAPEFILEFFKGKPIPVTSGQTCRFKRYNLIGDGNAV